MLNRAYVKVNILKDKKIVEEMLDELYPNINIEWDDNIGFFSVDGQETFQFQMEKLYSMALQYFELQLCILIVPFFDDLFIKYLSKMNNEVETAFGIFTKNISTIDVIQDSKKIIGRIDKKDLDTIKAFLSCNGNVCATASEIYLHRNSLNYRLNHFIDQTKIDIRDLNSLMFIKLILSINK